MLQAEYSCTVEALPHRIYGKRELPCNILDTSVFYIVGNNNIMIVFFYERKFSPKQRQTDFVYDSLSPMQNTGYVQSARPMRKSLQ